MPLAACTHQPREHQAHAGGGQHHLHVPPTRSTSLPSSVHAPCFCACSMVMLRRRRKCANDRNERRRRAVEPEDDATRPSRRARMGTCQSTPARVGSDVPMPNDYTSRERRRTAASNAPMPGDGVEPDDTPRRQEHEQEGSHHGAIHPDARMGKTAELCIPAQGVSTRAVLEEGCLCSSTT